MSDDVEVKTETTAKPIKWTASFRPLPGMLFTAEGEYLREQAEQLREEFTAEKRDELLQAIYDGAGNADTLRAQAELSYFLTMFQTNSTERGARQMAVATWVLAFATVGLLVATIVLVVVTSSHHS